MLSRTLSFSIAIILANAVGGKLSDSYLNLTQLAAGRVEAAISSTP